LDRAGGLFGKDDTKALSIPHLIGDPVFPQIPDGKASGNQRDRDKQQAAEHQAAT